MEERFRSKKIVAGGDRGGAAIMAALKQSNARVRAGRTGTSAAHPKEPKENNVRVRMSEALELVREVEELIAQAGCEDDPDFQLMCESVRKMDQNGTFSPKHVASLHTLVREASRARNAIDRVKQLQRVQGWVSEATSRVKTIVRNDAKASKAARREAIKRRNLQREALRQRTEKEEQEQQEAIQRQSEIQKKELRKNYEHLEKRSQVADWKVKKQHRKKLEEDEQDKIQDELRRQQRLQKKLVKQRQAAESARLDAECQADRAMRAATEAQQAHRRSKSSQSMQSMENEIERRVKEEVERQLKVAMAGAMARVETEMKDNILDMSIKAGNYHRQVAAQDCHPSMEVEEACVTDEDEGDWGDSDDEGFGETQYPAEVHERLCIVAEESDEDEDAGMHQYDAYGEQRWPSDVIEERLQIERAQLLGIMPEDMQAANAAAADANGSGHRPESPMSARFWEQPQHDSDAAVGDRVQAAVARARRMAELAHGRRSVAEESVRNETPVQPSVGSNLRGTLGGMQMLPSEAC